MTRARRTVGRIENFVTGSGENTAGVLMTPFVASPAHRHSTVDVFLARRSIHPITTEQESVRATGPIALRSG